MTLKTKDHWTREGALATSIAMNKRADTDKPAKAPPQTREERLKAALKANLSRRKAQARARDAAPKDAPKDE